MLSLRPNETNTDRGCISEKYEEEKTVRHRFEKIVSDTLPAILLEVCHYDPKENTLPSGSQFCRLCIDQRVSTLRAILKQSEPEIGRLSLEAAGYAILGLISRRYPVFGRRSGQTEVLGF
jgi:hypothetical protein